MGPVLGLYGKAYAKHIAGAKTSYDLIKETVMPKSFMFSSFNREGKLVTRPRVLFGTLEDDMKAYLQERKESDKEKSRAWPSSKDILASAAPVVAAVEETPVMTNVAVDDKA